MFDLNRSRILLGVGVAAVFAAMPAARAVEPDSSSVAFQDWTVNCAKTPTSSATPQAPAAKPVAGKSAEPAPAAAPAKEASTCEMVQSFVDKASQRLVARVAIGRTGAAGEMKLVIQTPVGVWLADGASVSASDKVQAKAVYVRCTPAACFAETDAKKEFLEAAKSADKMSLTFPDGARTPVAMAISPKGFAAALAALEKR